MNQYVLFLPEGVGMNSALHVTFHLRGHTWYYLIQVYFRLDTGTGTSMFFISSCRCELCTTHYISPEAAHRILPYPGLLPLYPGGRAVLGLVLDQPQGNRRQDRAWSVLLKNKQFNHLFQIWLQGHLCKLNPCKSLIYIECVKPKGKKMVKIKVPKKCFSMTLLQWESFLTNWSTNFQPSQKIGENNNH